MSIISFANRFAFIKTKKVAGTSVEALLRNFTGRDDIVPAVTPRDEHSMLLSGNFSKNYLRDKSQEQQYIDLVMQGQYEDATKFLSSQKKIAFSHMGYKKVVELIGKYGYNVSDFFIFTIERHPYSWLLSNVTYDNFQYNSKGSVDVQSRVQRADEAVRTFMNRSDFEDLINWGKYASGNEVLVDKVVDYNDLRKGIEESLNEIGVGFTDIELPDLKKGSRDLNAWDILSAESKVMAQNKFRDVFQLMRYMI